MKKRGFTLIELLAVIVVLGLISVITVPIVMNEVNKSKEESYEIGVQNTIESARTYVIENYSENDFPEGGIDVTSGLLNLKNAKYISGIIKKDEKGIIVVENISDGTYCSNGSRNELVTTKGDCSANDDTAPDVKVKLRESKSNSLIYSVTMSDSGSGIKEYKYCYQSCNNEKNWKTKKYEEPYPKKEIKDSIILKGLVENKTYTIKVKVINGNGYEKEVTNEKGKTKEIEAAKFKVSSSSYSGKKEVTIIYPEYQEGYTYSYEYNRETVKLESGKKEIKFEVTKTGTVTAKIKYEENGEQKEIVSKLNIVNIDKEGPSNVKVTYEDSWSKTKKVTIEATDEGSGLAYKAYKFDNGDWTSSKTKTYTKNARIKIKVKDRLGNETSTFNDGQTELVLNKVDTESATCSISVSGKNKEIEGKVWYTEKPTITVTYKDYYIDVDGKRVEGGSGVQEKSTMTLTTNGTTTTKEVTVSGNKYTTTLKDGMHVITFNVKDKAGNTEKKCNATIYVDSVKPSIKAKETENVAKYKADIDLLSTYFTISQKYGTLGGTTKCYTMLPDNKTEEITNNNKLTLGINKIKCIMTGKNGKTSTAETIIKHNTTSSNFTCPANWTKVGTTCQTGSNKCLKYEQKTDSSCGCATFKTCDDKTKCKTYEQKTDASCGCKTWNCKDRYKASDGYTSKTCSDIKYCNGTCKTYKCEKTKKRITSCTADNTSTKSPSDKGKTSNSLCAAQSGKVTTSFNKSKNTVTVTWYNFKFPYHGGGDHGVACYLGGVTKVKVGAGTVSCSSDSGHQHSEHTTYIGQFGYEKGNSDLELDRTGICVDLDTAEKKKTYTNKLTHNEIKGVCYKSGECGLSLTVTFSASKLKSGQRNYIMIADDYDTTNDYTDFLESYHSICTPTFESYCSKRSTTECETYNKDKPCGCNTTFNCKTWYKDGDKVNTTTCSAYKTCDDKTKCKTYEQKTDESCGCKTYKTCDDTTKCEQYDTKTDNKVRIYSLSGTNVFTGNTISATCDYNSNCTF